MKLKKSIFLVAACLIILGALSSSAFGTGWKQVFSDNFDAGKGEWWTDWSSTSEVIGGKLVLHPWMCWTAMTGSIYSAATPLRVAVDVTWSPYMSGPGILLRANSAGTTHADLICLLNPGLQGIYFHEYVYGSWGSQYDFVSAPYLGANIHMEATVDEAHVVTFSVSDGTHSYSTTHTILRPELQVDGYVGLWNGWVDASFDHFQVFQPSGAGATGTMIVSAKDSANNLPVSGALVSIQSPSYSETATTGGDGTYTFADIPVDTYEVAVAKTGYFRGTRSVTIAENAETPADVDLDAFAGMDWARCAAPTASADMADASKVNDGDPTSGWLPSTIAGGENVQLVWADPLTISTVLIDNAGPSQDYTVQYSTDGSSWTDIQHVTSSETGHTHYLKVIELPSPVTLKYLRVVNNSTDPAAVGAIYSIECYKQKGFVSGTVKDSTGAGISGANVYVYEAIAGSRGPSRLPIKGVTGAGGAYSVPTPEGKAMVTAAAADSIGVTSASVDVTGGNITSLPDLVVANRAAGSPAFSDNFNSVPNGQPDPQLDVQSGSMVGAGGRLQSPSDTGVSIATAVGVATRDSVIDVDTSSAGTTVGIVVRYFNADNFLAFVYNNFEKLSVTDVFNTQWTSGSTPIYVPVDAPAAHMHVVVAGNKAQAFISDTWNTYWMAPYTIAHNLSVGKAGLYASNSSAAAVEYDNLVITNTPAPGPASPPSTAKAGGPGWAGYVKGIVTGIFPEYNEIGLEAEDRSSGIIVLAGEISSLGLSLGDEMTVYGAVMADGRLNAGDIVPDVTRSGRNVDIQPLGTANKNLAVSAGSTGLDNRGMLVTTWGRVLHDPTTLEDGSKLFHITDGTALPGGTMADVPANAQLFFDDFASEKGSWWTDWTLPTEWSDGTLLAPGYGFTWSIVNSMVFKWNLPLRVTVDASYDPVMPGGPGILLRANRPDGATGDTHTDLICIYNPTVGEGSIYFHEFKNSNWGPQEGLVAAPDLSGPTLHLTAIADGPNVTFSVSDGVLSYTTSVSPFRPELLADGHVGIWNGFSDTYFDNFAVYGPLSVPLDSVQVVIPPFMTEPPTINKDDYVSVTGVACKGQAVPDGIRAIKTRLTDDLVAIAP